MSNVAAAEETIEDKLSTLNYIKSYKQIIQYEIKKKSLQNILWEKRRQLKLAKGKKSNIVFLCSRAATWTSMKTACNAFIDDSRFNVKIVVYPERDFRTTVPNCPESFGDYVFEYFAQTMPCRVIKGHNSTDRSFVDLQALEPDYVFYQTPYNSHRPQQFDTGEVSSYAKVCFIPYGMATFTGEHAKIPLSLDFYKDVFAVFTQAQEHTELLRNFFQTYSGMISAHLHLTGYARFDLIDEMHGIESPVWSYPKKEDSNFRIIWTPRWKRDQGHSHFLEYKDKFLDLCRNDYSVDFISRPHPLCFSEHVRKEFMTPEDIEAYENSFKTIPNATLDFGAEYLATFLSSSVLISDASSILHEYAYTGKPIIFCGMNNVDFNDQTKRLSESFYWAHNWEDILKLITMLKSGNDPLAPKRFKIIGDLYHRPGIKVGTAIKDYISEHFFI